MNTKNKYKILSSFLLCGIVTAAPSVHASTTSRNKPPEKPQNFESQLTEAIKAENLETVRSLINQGANPKFKELNGTTLLHRAATSGNLEIVQLLVENGADVNAQTQEKGRPCDTPLHLAVTKGFPEIVEYLLENNANVNLRNEWTGYNPLHYAVDKKNIKNDKYVEIVKALIDHGVNMQAKDTKAWSNPLHHAAFNGFKEAVEVMVEKGADINAKTHGHQTALDIARQHQQQEIVEFLEEKMKENQ